MGMSSHVIGLREEDDTYRKNMKLLDALKEAGIECIPKELQDWFGCNYVNDVNTDEILEVDIDDAISDVEEKYQDGFYVDLSVLPPGVSKLKFYNSY
jgi:ACT domain-containing protein